MNKENAVKLQLKTEEILQEISRLSKLSLDICQNDSIFQGIKGAARMMKSNLGNIQTEIETIDMSLKYQASFMHEDYVKKNVQRQVNQLIYYVDLLQSGMRNYWQEEAKVHEEYKRLVTIRNKIYS